MPPEYASVALDASNIILSTLSHAANMAPIPGLQSAAASALNIVEMIQNVRSNKSAFKQLAHEACALVYIIICTHGKASVSPTYLTNANELSDTLQHIAKFALAQGSKKMIMRVVQSKSDAGTIQEYRDRLKHSLDVFGLRSSFSMQDSLADINRKLDNLHARLPPPTSQAAHLNDSSEVQMPKAHEESNQLERRKEGAGERSEADRREKEQLWSTGDVQRPIRQDPKHDDLDHEGRQTYADIRKETNQNPDYLHPQRSAPTNRPMERVKQDDVEHSRPNIERGHREAGPVNSGEGVRRIVLEERRRNDVEDRQKDWEDAEPHRESSQYTHYPHSPEPQSFRQRQAENHTHYVKHDSRNSDRERRRNAVGTEDSEWDQRLQRDSDRAQYERTRQEENYGERDQYSGPYPQSNPQPTRNTGNRNPFRPSTPSYNDRNNTPDSFHSQNSRPDIHFENTFPFVGQHNHFRPLLDPSTMFAPPSAASWPALPTFQPPWYDSGQPGHPAYGGFSSISGGHNVYVNSPVNENSGNTISVTVTDSHNVR
ncbi:hypothetical protein H0H92_007888 [Tricholoma furcatifolium]|nr:hypothetical protein H0H92_007888 [Tricholoma furcatifolium]